MTLTFSPRASYGHYSYTCKNQGQIFKRSVDSKDTVQNDGETNTPDRITFPANAVGDESAFDRPHPVFSAQVIARVSGGS